jgi:hypothetical protein
MARKSRIAGKNRSGERNKDKKSGFLLKQKTVLGRPASRRLLYGMKRLIAVGADNFLFTGIDSQIQCFKRNSAEQYFLGIGQYEGFANCPSVFPQYFQ